MEQKTKEAGELGTVVPVLAPEHTESSNGGRDSADGVIEPPSSAALVVDPSPAASIGLQLQGCFHFVSVPAGHDGDGKSSAPVVDKPVREFPFKLDDFQSESIACVHASQNVLVAAHTSAGKTAVAEYAIAMALEGEKKSRVIYTTPIKALSNQKYRQLKEKFTDVGLMTGDVNIAPHASCLVMTTEILRNMMLRGSEVIREVTWVVFDEIHYMRDRERGVVWEESIILLPASINLIFLSATLTQHDSKQFSEWICSLKSRPCHVVSTDARPVPLHHYAFPSGSDFLFLAMDENRNVKHENITAAMDAMYSDDSQGGGGDGRAKMLSSSRRPPSAKAQVNDMLRLLQMLSERKSLPIIVFCFSRRECESHALEISKLDLNTTEEKKLLQEVFDKALLSISEEDRDLPQIKLLLPLLRRGIGVHHSGLLPILREIVEILFQESLIKVLFATETFAMGVNMPAKTCLFANLQKFDGQTFRWITSGEYTQMSGRAGRRGIDDHGVSVVMLTPEVTRTEIQRILSGPVDPLNSTFRLSYNIILNLLRTEAQVTPEYVIKRSLHQFQYEQMQPSLRSDLDAIATDRARVAGELRRALLEAVQQGRDGRRGRTASSGTAVDGARKRHLDDEESNTLAPRGNEKKWHAASSEPALTASREDGELDDADPLTLLSTSPSTLAASGVAAPVRATASDGDNSAVNVQNRTPEGVPMADDSPSSTGDVLANRAHTQALTSADDDAAVVALKGQVELALSLRSLRKVLAADVSSCPTLMLPLMQPGRLVYVRTLHKLAPPDRGSKPAVATTPVAPVPASFSSSSSSASASSASEREWGWGVVVNFRRRFVPADYVVDVLVPIHNPPDTVGRLSVPTPSHSARITELPPGIDITDAKCSRSSRATSSSPELAIVAFTLDSVAHVSATRIGVSQPADLSSRAAMRMLWSRVYDVVVHQFASGAAMPVLSATAILRAHDASSDSSDSKSVHPYCDPAQDAAVSLIRRTVTKLTAVTDRLAHLEKESYTHTASHDFEHLLVLARQDEELADKLAAVRRRSAPSQLLQFKTELRSRMRVLRRLGYVDDEGIMLQKGRMAAEIEQVNELVLTELVFQGLFAELSPAESVAVLTCMFELPRLGATSMQSATAALQKHAPKMLKLFDRLQKTAREVANVLIEFGLASSVDEFVNEFKPSLMLVALEWCRGRSFAHICSLTEMFEGSIVRCFRRLSELLTQLGQAAHSVGAEALELNFQEGAKLLRHGIVFAGSLYL